MIVFHLVSGFAKLGGVQSHLKQVAPYLANRNVTHKIVALESFGFTQIGENLRVMQTISIILLQCLSDKVTLHCHNLIGGKAIVLPLVLKIITCGSIRVVHHERGAIWTNREHLNSLDHLFLWLCSALVCNSKASKIALISSIKFLEKKQIQVVYNYPIKQGCYYKFSQRQKIRLIQKKFGNVKYKRTRHYLRVGFVGRGDPIKGLHVFSKIANSFRYDDRIKFFVYGPGANPESEVRKFAFDNMGYLDRDMLMNELLGLDVVIVPSLREPFGNVVWDCAIAGVKVWCTRVDGVLEALKVSGLSGFNALPLTKTSSKSPFEKSGYRNMQFQIRHGHMGFYNHIARKNIKELDSDIVVRKIKSLLDGSYEAERHKQTLVTRRINTKFFIDEMRHLYE